MVRDANSAGGQPPHRADDSTTPDLPLDPRGNTANLTEELARLLAATIAQGQAGKRLPGAATGSELASLAALISASQGQRAVQPSFRDGLSSLSYTPPPASPAPSAGLLVSEQHDDEPMPIPSTWRQPMNSDDERWYRQQLGAAALGLVAGLIVVVPSVLWLSGWFGGPQARSAARPAAADQGAAIKMADVKVKVVPLEKTENASQYVTAAVDPRPAAVEAPPPVMEKAPVTLPAPTPIAAPSPKPVEPQRPRVEEVLAQARRHIERGDINSARELLLAGQSAAPGPIAFTLAETYDPNMLAAWNTRGVISDVHKARSLYLKALELGDGRARKRLDELR